MTENDPRDVEHDAEASGLSRATRGAISVEGIVRESLPYAQYRVEIDGHRQVTAHTPSGPGKNFMRVLIGDRVRLELSPRDRSRGRIVEKLG